MAFINHLGIHLGVPFGQLLLILFLLLYGLKAFVKPGAAYIYLLHIIALVAGILLFLKV